MTLALTLAAIRRHPFSVACTTLLTLVTASLLGASAPLSLAIWILGGVLTFELWYAVEPTLLRQLGSCRTPSDVERQRLEAALGRSDVCLLVAQTGDLAAARTLRCLVVGRDLMDLFEDRALCGYLNQIAASMHSANLAGFGLVWLGNLPILGAWLATRLVGQLGRFLALVLGTSLVIPLVLFRDAFLCWAGRVFGSILVGLLASMLLFSGYAAAGGLLMIAWLVTPVLGAILAWESRRVERSADRATIAAGYGPQLLEAADLLSMAEPLPVEGSLLSVLCLPGTAIVERSRRIRRELHGD